MLSSVKYGDIRFTLDPVHELEYDLSILEACHNIDHAESPDLCAVEGSSPNECTKAGLRRRRTSVSTTVITSGASGVRAGEGLDDGPERKRQRVTEELD